jgi:hypothetical protein
MFKNRDYPGNFKFYDFSSVYSPLTTPSIIEEAPPKAEYSPNRIDGAD